VLIEDFKSLGITLLLLSQLLLLLLYGYRFAIVSIPLRKFVRIVLAVLLHVSLEVGEETLPSASNICAEDLHIVDDPVCY
jgi:hypothetical protein